MMLVRSIFQLVTTINNNGSAHFPVIATTNVESKIEEENLRLDQTTKIELLKTPATKQMAKQAKNRNEKINITGSR